MDALSQPIRSQFIGDAHLGDYAWRVGARNREEVERSLQCEIDAMHERFGTHQVNPTNNLPKAAMSGTVIPVYV